MPSQNDLRSIEEIPLPYQSIFSQYPCFNVVQSAVLDLALKTDTSFVVSAPTGSGKTAVFELAIVRYLFAREKGLNALDNKVIYISPIKALCEERLVDWHKKFSGFGVNCISVTSDNDEVDLKALLQYNIIISTPEKWDVLTRRWMENNKLIDAVSMFLIDEVHLLNADLRGSTLEVIVSRMKTDRGSYMFNGDAKSIRFIALSATIPNIEDIAEWMGQSEPAKYFQFSEEVRPVKLNKIVLGYNFNPQAQSVFKFDMSLSYKISGLISKHSEGKPTLIFCNTRKSVEMTANHLVTNLQIRLSQEQKEVLMRISQSVVDVKLRQYIVHGIAFHHAGLMPNTRQSIEESFKKGQIPVLVTTSTLAMGVNLPAHLVIVKCTKCYSDGGYKDYDEVSIFQMIGRAGRSQFDTSATVLILTSLQDKSKYEQMLSCSQIIESNLHKHLTEHLNAEVVLRTITDLEVAMRWLSSTFLYVRARKSPQKYKLPAGLSKDKIDKKLLEMCQIELNKLVATGMIRMNQAIEITPTVIGEIMAKYYVAFETMKLFTQITGSEVLIQILSIISKCKEFSNFYLRTTDKRCLNLLNKDSKKETVRFPLTGRIKSNDMKVNVIIQAILGNLDIHNQAVACDAMKIMRCCERLANCLIEYLETRNQCFSALSSTITLAKCFRVKLWENSPYVSKQLTGVGQVISTLLMKAEKTTFKEIANTNPRHIEMIVNRKAPFGNSIVDEALRLPQYAMTLQRIGACVHLLITLMNPSEIEQKCTVSLASMMILLVGDSDNNILLYEKYAHSYMLDTLEVRRSFTITDSNLEFIKACYISENWVGIDCFYTLNISTNTTSNVEKKTNKRQTCLDSYVGINKVKKSKTNKMANKGDTKTTLKETNKSNVIIVKEANLPKAIIQDENKFGSLFEYRNTKDTNESEKQMEAINQTARNSKCVESSNNPKKSEKASQHTSEVNKSPVSGVKEGGDNQKVKLVDSKRTDNFNKNTFNIKKTEGKTIQQLDKTFLPLASVLDEEPISTSKSDIVESRTCDKPSNLVFGGTSEATSEQTICTTVSTPTKNSTESGTTKGKRANHIRANNIKHSEGTNQFEQGLEASTLNSTFMKNISKKYIFEANQPKVNECMENKADSSHGKPKKIMDNPDSTVDHLELRRYFASPDPRNQRRSDNRPPAFDFFPQKSIKWRSPLVHSPTVKYSPLRPADFNFESKRVDHFKENSDSIGCQDSFSSRHSNATDISDKQVSHFIEPAKKKSKHKFPLTDQEYTEEENESFSPRVKGLEDICDPEYFGLSNRREDSAVKYYSKLMNTSTRSDESITKPPRNNVPQTGTVKKSADNKAEMFESSQDLFSQGDFLALSKKMDISRASGHKEPKTPELHARGGSIAPPSFPQPSNAEYMNNFSNVPYNRNNGHDNFNATIPSTPKTCFDTGPVRPTSHSQSTGRYAADPRYYNPYVLNEPGYSPHQSHYFSYQPIKPEHFHQRPMPTTPNICLCCGHPSVRQVNENYRYNPRSEDPMGTHPYNGYMDERSPYSNSSAVYPRVNDIPENYIDSCLQQLDVEPVNHPSDRTNSVYRNNLQTDTIRKNAQPFNPEHSMVPRTNLNFENNQLIYPDNQKEKINRQFLAASGFEQHSTSLFAPIVENNQHYPQNVHRERQPENNRRFIKEVFTPTPKPQLLHNSPPYNRATTLPNVPALSQRKQLNFNSFEERLDNIIMPNQGLPSRFTHRGVDRYNNYNMLPCSNPNRQFLIDRFMDPNSHRGTQ